MQHPRNAQILTALFALFLLVAGSAFGASMTLGAASVNFAADGPGTVIVSGPDDFLYRADLKAGKGSMSLFDDGGQHLADGAYTWQITLDGQAPPERSGKPVEGQSFSGTFTLAGGSVANPDLPEGGLFKDEVINDDLIVDGSACVGSDCANGLNFAFDTLILKENNTRLLFDDTSTSNSFPKNDWRLTANDSGNGGAEYFAIEDATGGRIPFRIEAGASSNAFYVDGAGDVGLGTSTPALELHIVDGNSPSIRLEQDGSAGFDSHTWDISGNEALFFVREAISGSPLPLQIEAGAPNASLYADSDGNIGLGLEKPTEEIHIKRTSGNAAVRLETTDSAGGADWIVRAQTNGSLQIRDENAGTIPVRVGATAQSNLLNIGMSADGTTEDSDRINITGELYINGADNSTPDYVFGADYELETIAEHAEFMWSNHHLPAVSPAELGADGKTTFNLVDRSQGVLEELEKAHIYIEQMHHTLQHLSERIEQLETE